MKTRDDWLGLVDRRVVPILDYCYSNGMSPDTICRFIEADHGTGTLIFLVYDALPTNARKCVRRMIVGLENQPDEATTNKLRECGFLDEDGALLSQVREEIFPLANYIENPQEKDDA